MPLKRPAIKYSTRSAITVSISDMTVPEEKKDLLANAEKTIDSITKNFRRVL